MFGFFKRSWRRRAAPVDWFACPVCGAEVRVGSLACRSCGSDGETGWSEATAYDDLNLPEPDGPEIPDTFEDFERMTRGAPFGEQGNRGRWFWALFAFGVLFVVGNAILVGLHGPW